jgi:hypothetical protein
MKYFLRTNRKKISAGSTSDRDRQFRYLCRQRDQFEKRGDPVLSVDAKKRELIGNFKNPGVKWEQSSTDVNDHDFRSASQGIGIPYGIYDMASTTPRPTAAVCFWELPTKHPPSLSLVFASGGKRKDTGTTPNPAPSSFWPILAAVMARSVAPGSRRFSANSPCLNRPFSTRRKASDSGHRCAKNSNNAVGGARIVL